MAEAVLDVTQVGPVTTVQDGGRPGLMRFGVPRSGPMDRRAFAAANVAVGNAAGASAIEVSVGGLALQCLAGAVSVAVAGGGFRVVRDGLATTSWTRHRLEKGSALAIQPGPWGSWAYLAFAGRLVSPRWLGSAATHLLSGLGGGPVAVGQRLTIADAAILAEVPETIPFPATARPRPVVRVVIGPQERFFAPTTVAALLAEPFTLTPAYDRMGVRLEGPRLSPRRPLDMPSEPILRGALQVSGDGIATALLADHQTTGGYPKIATMVADDVDSFVQLRPRQRVMFSAITPEAAVASARTRQRTWAAYLQALAGTGTFASRPEP